MTLWCGKTITKYKAKQQINAKINVATTLVIIKCSLLTGNLPYTEFIKVVKRVKKKKCDYDCLIPVSGGKDSTWQVITALIMYQSVTQIKTPVRSKIGIQNLENLIKLGVDHYDVTINPDVYISFYIQ